MKTKQLVGVIAFGSLFAGWMLRNEYLSAEIVSTSLSAVDESSSSLSVASELKSIVEKQSEAWNRGDLEQFMVPYWRDDRLTFSSGGTTERGWNATLRRYQKRYPDKLTMGKLVFGDLETMELGEDSVLMLGTWKLERAEPIEGNFTLVWKKIDNHWVIVHDHSSSKAK
jgi:beta-aspartyl-peptidase (threonine type)